MERSAPQLNATQNHELRLKAMDIPSGPWVLRPMACDVNACPKSERIYPKCRAPPTTNLSRTWLCQALLACQCQARRDKVAVPLRTMEPWLRWHGTWAPGTMSQRQGPCADGLRAQALHLRACTGSFICGFYQDLDALYWDASRPSFLVVLLETQNIQPRCCH